jgi:hypothetical protein
MLRYCQHGQAARWRPTSSPGIDGTWPSITGGSTRRISNGAVASPSMTSTSHRALCSCCRSLPRSRPGSGKTTAANVLMYWQSATPDARVPFLVTLREFASAGEKQRSVLGYVSEKLEGFYQCPAPPGTLERLLLSGQALVVFDGLDELTDTAHRSEVAAIIERFCAEYPLAQVLVTSRIVGYDQTRLDDGQFTRYRIGAFDEQQVSEYVRKWFAQEEGVPEADADRQAAAFLAESAGVPDLRANPLMLALMCVLYRGEGSIPRNRPEVYEQCSILLLRRWDARRHIHVQLRAGAQAEATTRHLAYWLFTQGQDQQVVTERELLRETSAFLADRSFEDPDQAVMAANEFITFCRDRAWVFSGAGVTAAGQRLYTFTHQAFLEYFAAAHLAAVCDTPEQLVVVLAPRIAQQEWDVVAELAIQIKSSGIARGEERAYSSLLSSESFPATSETVPQRGNILAFLARCTRFLDPPPRTIRALVRATLDHLFGGDISDEDRYQPLSWLLVSCAKSRDIVREEIASRISRMIASPDRAVRLSGLRLAVWVGRGAVHHQDGLIIVPARAPEDLAEYWDAFAYDNVRRYALQVTEAAADDEGMLYASLRHRFRTAADVLAVPGADLTVLLQAHQATAFSALWTSYLLYLAGAATRGWARSVHSGLPRATQDTLDEDFEAVGRYLASQSQPPWASVCPSTRYEPVPLFDEEQAHLPAAYQASSPVAYLGAAITVLLTAEVTRDRVLPPKGVEPLGAFTDLYPYILRRWGADPAAELPDIPAPTHFQRLMREWANNNADFIQVTDSQHP